MQNVYIYKRVLADSPYLSACARETMALDIDRTKYLLRICSSDAKRTVEEEIKRIEARRISFRHQIEKRISHLTDQDIQHDLDIFKCARAILQNRTRDHNEILDENSVSSLLFFKHHRCLSRKSQHRVRMSNTDIILQQDSAPACGFELSL